VELWPAYKLKQLIDLVAQRNYLFAYDSKRHGPLLNVAKAVVVCTRGSRFLEGTPIPPSRLLTRQLIWTFGCNL
jgi:FMN-dependent NADH-azoreductase